MARTHASRLALGCALILVPLASCDDRHSAPATEARARHLVLISLDTTRADQFGFYGNTEIATPRLDELAAESVVLEDLMTVAPTTLASHVSLMTGKYPHTHGTPRNGFVVNDRNAMLAELLREQGFTTAGFAGSFALDSRFNFAQGFDHYDETFDRLVGQAGRLQNERTARAVTDAAVSWLDENGVPDRLFLFVHYFDAHGPYEAPPPYDTMYDPRGRDGLPAWRPQGFVRVDGSNENVQRLAKQYAGEISYMDEHVGRLFDELRRRGVMDEAMVVVTSDHGENFWEHPAAFDHGWSTYQTTMHSVGLVRLPGGAYGGSRIRGVAATIDLFPTIAGYLGIPVPEGVEGESIDLDAPDAAPLERVRFGQATKPWDEVEMDPGWANMAKARCVRQGRYKLIQVPYAGTEELYDLEADPLEQNDLLPQATPEFHGIAGRLRERLESWAASADPLSSRFEPSQREETIERLRALGYLGGDGSPD